MEELRNADRKSGRNENLLQEIGVAAKDDAEEDVSDEDVLKEIETLELQLERLKNVIVKGKK